MLLPAFFTHASLRSPPSVRSSVWSWASRHRHGSSTRGGIEHWTEIMKHWTDPCLAIIYGGHFRPACLDTISDYFSARPPGPKKMGAKPSRCVSGSRLVREGPHESKISAPDPDRRSCHPNSGYIGRDYLHSLTALTKFDDSDLTSSSNLQHPNDTKMIEEMKARQRDPP